LGADECNINPYHTYSSERLWNELIFSEYGVEVTGSGWDYRSRKAILAALKAVGSKFAETTEEEDSASEAFRNVYHTNDESLVFLWNENCWGCRPVTCYETGEMSGSCKPKYGFATGTHLIEFASLTDVGFVSDDVLFQRWTNNMIHELGHVFDYRIGEAGRNSISGDLLNRPDGFRTGGGLGTMTWQMSGDETPSEIFADMFLGHIGTGSQSMWADDHFGIVRANHMDSRMRAWIALAINQ